MTSGGPSRCVVGQCETPFDNVLRRYYEGDPNNGFLDLCAKHQGYFTEWKAPWRRRVKV